MRSLKSAKTGLARQAKIAAASTKSPIHARIGEAGENIEKEMRRPRRDGRDGADARPAPRAYSAAFFSPRISDRISLAASGMLVPGP